MKDEKEIIKKVIEDNNNEEEIKTLLNQISKLLESDYLKNKLICFLKKEKGNKVCNGFLLLLNLGFSFLNFFLFCVLCRNQKN